MRRLFILTIVLLSPLALYAQSNDLGVFVSSASYSSSDFTDPEEPGLSLEIEFERGTGFGVSYNRFWTPNVSTEFAYTSLPSNAKVNITDGTNSVSADVGDAQFQIFSGIAQWHFGTGRIRPYVGAGVARIDGDIDIEDDETGETTTEDLGSETSWIANGGISFGVTPRFSISLDARYLPFQLDDDPEPGSEPVDINVDPLILSAGAHVRF